MSRTIILVIAVCHLAINIARSQQVVKIKMPESSLKPSIAESRTNAPSLITPQSIQKMKQANNYVTLYKNGNRVYLDSLMDFLESPSARTSDSFLKPGRLLLAKAINALDSPGISKSLDTIPIPKDTAKILKTDSSNIHDSKDTSKKLTSSCAKLREVVDLNLEKTLDGDYVFSLVDAQQNPLKSFTLKQFNESLFLDELRKSISALCTTIPLAKDDSLYIAGIIQSFSNEKLYDRMLEASLEVNDADVYAGELRVTKIVPVKFQYSSEKQKRLKKDSVSEKKNNKTIDKNRNGGTKSSFLIINKFDLPDSLLIYSKKDTYLKEGLTPDTAKIDSFRRAFTVFSIDIQFQDGFIENIIVLGKIAGDNRLLKFENEYPLAFSTRNDFRKLYTTPIYERTIYSSDESNQDSVESCLILLGDLLFYKQQLDVNSKDYSPANQVYHADLTDAITTINLKKELTSKILELKVYTDLKGIDNAYPNGLVQFELSKKLNLWNNREEVIRNTLNIGFLNFGTPYFTLNKLENNNKRLVANYQGTQQKDTSRPNTFSSTINLFEYQTFGVGFNLTCFTIDVPGLKSTFNLNLGAFFGRTLMQDTARTKIDSASFTPTLGNNVVQFGVNSFQVTPEFCWQIYPDKRYGVTFSQKFIHYSIFNTEVKQVRDTTEYEQYLNSLKGNRSEIDNYSLKKWLGSAEIYAFFKPSDYNQVFFRYRYNWNLGDAKLNFYQLQLGISTYLTHTKKDKANVSD
jgi:hypothetical protein